jgi:hypothetical protein
MFARDFRDHDVIDDRDGGGSGHSPVATNAATEASTSFTRAERARSSVRSRLAQSRHATWKMPGPTVSSHRGPSASVPGSSWTAGNIAAAASTSSGEGNAGVHSPATVSGTESSSRSSVVSVGLRPDMAHRTSPGRPPPAAGGAAGSDVAPASPALLPPARAGGPATPPAAATARAPAAGLGEYERHGSGNRDHDDGGREPAAELAREWDTAGLLGLEGPSGVLGPSEDARHRRGTREGLRCEVREKGRRGQAAQPVRAARRRRRRRSGRRVGETASGGQGGSAPGPRAPASREPVRYELGAGERRWRWGRGLSLDGASGV